MTPDLGPIDQSLRDRATKVVPGGMYGHTPANGLPAGYPQFFSHGAIRWCSPHPYGVISEDRAHILYFDYNDIASREAAVDQGGNDLAAIVVSAFKHDYGHHQALPDPAFAARARALCDANDAALILDDVRAGFRLTLHGSWDQIGVQPDLSAWSKAIANGYALSAVMGNDRFRDAAAQLFATGSFWSRPTSLAP